jgi:hypothetical protein
MTYKGYLAAGTIVASLMLAGCTASVGGGTTPPADCGAAALQGKIGQPVTGQTAADVRVGGEPVQSRGNVRVVAPGQAVTMDFNPERLTIETDAQGNLVRAQCT